eukprot:1196124-Prorocentrum_minimum.AAC.3
MPHMDVTPNRKGALTSFYGSSCANNGKGNSTPQSAARGRSRSADAIHEYRLFGAFADGGHQHAAARARAAARALPPPGHHGHLEAPRW